ncbi:3-oxoadipyl-CoA/3-oxo-5,6-dehydrosuberyl-CoA thiolase [Variovorax sp. PBL-H6]|uniref:thiolase family protein n=1 Tax=Variovorax sp. PBL-H6 TaxID=434009 RepID=UPI001317DD7C|nr:thiolase family protein [Variovorax sp. PBL-H6]VTU33069.1 3-oxoadipyl-CoA/3-oxo-5,6-dehydrosuberyl-CoA thiolase [Variovorax sp. PBL-H6]
MSRRTTYVVGTGMVPFGRFPELSHREFAWPAARAAILESGFRKDEIDVAYSACVLGGMLTGQQILGKIGLTGLPIINIENACSSGSTALGEAIARIQAGMADVALVVGVDMLSKLGRGPLPLSPDDWDAAHGLTMPGVYAMRAQRYLHEHGISRTDLSRVAVKARANGARNPLAQLTTPITLEEAESSRIVADPLRLAHCCPTGDGAAAVVIASEDWVKRSSCTMPIKVAATVLHSGHFDPGPISMVKSHVSTRSAAEAYEAAGIGPEDIDVAEIHDSFSIAELMYYEAFGFAGPGEAVALLRSGQTELGGKHVINPSGGLMARGHPIAATGVAQIVEISRQLQGRNGAHQVEGARIGLCHATGGGISGFEHGACAVTILTR